MDPVFIDLAMPVPAMAETQARVVILADTMDELLSEKTRQQAYATLHAVVTSRGLAARGGWALCNGMVDDPDWADVIDPAVASKVRAKMETMGEAHLLVFAIAHLDDVTPC